MRAFTVLCLAAQTTVMIAAPAIQALGQGIGHVERRHVSIVEGVNTQQRKAVVTVTVTVTGVYRMVNPQEIYTDSIYQYSSASCSYRRCYHWRRREGRS